MGFTYNEHTGHYEAMDGGHSIYISDDVFMTELELLMQQGYSEAEALQEVYSVDWWYQHLPLSGVYIDGIEQNDTGIESYEERHP